MAHHRRPSTINLDPAFTRQSTQVIGGTHSIFSSGSDSDGSTFELPDTGDYIPSSSGSSSDDEKFVDSNMVNYAPGSPTDSSPSKRPTRQRVVAVIKKSGAIQYTYDNQLLPAVESRHSEMPGYDDTDDDKKLELTSWCIDYLYRSTHNDVREIIESATDIQSLIELKPIRLKGNPAWPAFDLRRQQNASATAAMLMLEPKNRDEQACQSCAGRGKGPFLRCVTFKNIFGGACANCQYHSGAKGCSLRQSDATSSKAGKKRKASDSAGDGLTMFDWLDQLDTTALTQLEKEIRIVKRSRIG